MNRLFINKVRNTILEHMEDHNFGVSELATELSLSNSQLLRKVKRITGKSVNSLIREIRLKEALVLIKEEELTAAEIAYKVGFNSPSYFSKCFHEYFGYTTAEMKNQNEESFELDRSHRETIKPLSKKNRKSILVGASILIVIIFYVFINSSRIQKTNTQSTSIAVLPFKNLSDDESLQNFVDGTMDLILSHLSSIDGFNPISGTTMEQFNETTKTTPEIAKELNISYLLEATVQKYGDEVRFTIHLIDAKNDEQIWSDDFQGVLKDVFLLQSNIAKDVRLAIKRKLFPNTLEKIDTLQIKNIEADNLHSKGRFYWHRRTKDDFKISIFYLEQAIKLDSTNASSYAVLADVYATMTWWKWYPKDEGYIKTMELVTKALSIDNTVSEAYAALGSLVFWYEWKPEIAEKNLKIAISLNPKYATAHRYYAHLLNALGRRKEAREQINIAINLNPNSISMYQVSSHLYYCNGEFEKAIVERKKVLEFNGKKSDAFIFSSYVHLGMNLQAIEHLKLIVSDESNEDYKLIDEIYQESGMNGVTHWFLEEHETKDSYRAFLLYGLIGERDKVMGFIDKNPLYRRDITTTPDFNKLKFDSIFNAFMKEVTIND